MYMMRKNEMRMNETVQNGTRRKREGINRTGHNEAKIIPDKAERDGKKGMGQYETGKNRTRKRDETKRDMTERKNGMRLDKTGWNSLRHDGIARDDTDMANGTGKNGHDKRNKMGGMRNDVLGFPIEVIWKHTLPLGLGWEKLHYERSCDSRCNIPATVSLSPATLYLSCGSSVIIVLALLLSFCNVAHLRPCRFDLSQSQPQRLLKEQVHNQ
ncbi:unnamed protein product [Microthlaspi erraticum]|uniref:Uncharacterized protein n=1 Tax=Microthlaspi erraticum TaxID=1685480 RepID=A0A6D2KJG4_9BRAS|nr:unnamed protein product [Microthlaspi erraticum]